MNKKKIAYWITTALTALTLLGSGFAKLTGDETIIENMNRMGFPSYMSTILGFWYVAAAVAIVAPGMGRIKEWAYAGAFFALSGAGFSHIAMGDSLSQLIPVVVIIGLILSSYFLRPGDRRIAAS